MKMERLIGIRSILLQRDKVTAPELAEQFEVSRRTIQRDIESLCQAGIPIATAQGTGGGISILEGYRVTPQNLLTPGYDFSRRAEEKTLPIPDGMTCWLDGTLIRAFRVERLPESLSKAEWLAFRVPAGERRLSHE